MTRLIDAFKALANTNNPDSLDSECKDRLCQAMKEHGLSRMKSKYRIVLINILREQEGLDAIKTK